MSSSYLGAVAGFHSWPECYHDTLTFYVFPSIRPQTMSPEMMCQAKATEVTNRFHIWLVYFSFDPDVIFCKRPEAHVMHVLAWKFLGVHEFPHGFQRCTVVLRFMSEGFLDAKKLALKFSTLYALNKDSFSSTSVIVCANVRWFIEQSHLCIHHVLLARDAKFFSIVSQSFILYFLLLFIYWPLIY